MMLHTPYFFLVLSPQKQTTGTYFIAYCKFFNERDKLVNFVDHYSEPNLNSSTELSGQPFTATTNRRVFLDLRTLSGKYSRMKTPNSALSTDSTISQVEPIVADAHGHEGQQTLTFSRIKRSIMYSYTSRNRVCT